MKSMKSLLADRIAKKNINEVEMTDEVLVTALEKIDEVVEQVQASTDTLEQAASIIDELSLKVTAQEDEIKKLKEVSVSESEEGEVKSERKALNTAIRTSIKSANKNLNIITNGQMQGVKSTNGKIVGSTIPEFSNAIIERVVETSEVIKMFDTIPVGTPDFSLPVNVGHTKAAFGLGYNVGHSDIAWNKGSFGVGSCKPVLSENTINDAFFDVYGWVQKQIADDFGQLFAQGALYGTGVDDQPKGFMTFFDSTKATEAQRGTEYFKTTDLSAETDRYKVMNALNEMVVDLPTKFKGNAVYVLSRKAYLMISTMRDEVGLPLLARSAQDPNVYHLNGFPVVYDLLLEDDAPVVFGSMKEAFSLLSFQNSLVVKQNEWQLDGHVCYPASFRLGTIVKDCAAAIAIKLPAEVDLGPTKPTI